MLAAVSLNTFVSSMTTMRSLLMLLLFSLLFTSCGEDTPVAESAQLEGNWELVRGLRNKLGHLFMPPGWEPIADEARQKPSRG